MQEPTNTIPSNTVQRLRICHIIEATAGGSARIAAQLMQDQLGRGADVTLIYSKIRADAWFTHTIETMPGLQVIALPMQREVGFRDSIAFLRLLRILFTLDAFDVIHSHSSKAGALARLCRFFIHKPVQIYSPHAFYTMSNVKTPVYGWIEKFLSHLSDAIILVSPLEYRHASEKLNIRQNKLHVVLNGIDIGARGNRAHARALLGASQNQAVVGFVGRLEEAKNPERLIEAFRLIAKQRSDAFLTIIGEGSLKELTQKLIARYCLEDRVQFIISNDARTLISGFDCLICTSDYESFCLVMIEALAENVPVVTTPVGISEVAIIPGKNGYIASFDPQSLADHMVTLLSQDYKTRQKQMIASQDIVEKFNIEVMMQQSYAIYLHTLSLKK